MAMVAKDHGKIHAVPPFSFSRIPDTMTAKTQWLVRALNNKVVLGILFVIFILVVWQLTYLGVRINKAVIPPPTVIAASFVNGIVSGTLITNAAASLFRVVVGFLSAAVAGIGLGLLMGYYTLLRALLEPVVEILRPIPPIAWIPIAILIFGIGNAPAFFIVFIGAFFPIYLNTSFGALQLPQKFRNISRTLELSDYRYFKDVLLKFTLPYTFTGLRIGIGMAWMSVIAAEMIGAQNGLGYYILVNQITLNTSNVVAGMLVIGLLGYALSVIIKLAERYTVPWKGA